MGKRRIVIALGGNALGSNLPEQMKAVKITARAIVDLIEDGNEVVICHGNGPQVGMIQNAMAESRIKYGKRRRKRTPKPLLYLQIGYAMCACSIQYARDGIRRIISSRTEQTH